MTAFDNRTAADLKDAVNTILGRDDEDLNDLAVLVLFSVFEATVRARAKADVDRETALMRHPAVLSAIKNLKDSIENGSFAKITEAYKKMDDDLTTQVNQVRKFRNWVAHGRRDEPENSVDPKAAKGRLDLYLQRLAELEVAGEMSEAKQKSRASQQRAVTTGGASPQARRTLRIDSCEPGQGRAESGPLAPATLHRGPIA